MTKFDILLGELEWKRLYKNIGVYFKGSDKNGYCTIAFPVDASYENFDLDDDKLDKEFVGSFIRAICCHSKFKKSNVKWITPLLVSDYFAHRRDFKNELVWAKKAMKQNIELTPSQFSINIREQLLNYGMERL